MLTESTVAGRKKDAWSEEHFDNKDSEILWESGREKMTGNESNRTLCLDSSGSEQVNVHAYIMYVMHLKGGSWKPPVVTLHESIAAICDSQVLDLWKLWNLNHDHESAVIC